MDVSHETPDVTTKPKCYDLTNIRVQYVSWKDPSQSQYVNLCCLAGWLAARLPACVRLHLSAPGRLPETWD